MTREHYIAMLKTGRDYKGFIQNGGYADRLNITIESNKLEYMSNITFARDTVFYQALQVPVCLLSVPEPSRPDLENLNRKLQIIRDSIISAQRFDNMDELLLGYRSVETECINLINRNAETGRGFTERAKDRVNTLLLDVRKKLHSNIRQLEILNDRKNVEQNLDKRLNIIKDIQKLKNANDELQIIIKELVALANSTQVYDILNENARATNNDKEITGSMEFDLTSNAVILKAIQGDLALLAHELKHAFQFEMGQIEIGGSRFLYDRYDEIDAYERGAIFGGQSYKNIGDLPLIYQKDAISTIRTDIYNSPYTRFTMDSPIKDLIFQNISNRTNTIFRIDNKTYIPIKSKP